MMKYLKISHAARIKLDEELCGYSEEGSGEAEAEETLDQQKDAQDAQESGPGSILQYL